MNSKIKNLVKISPSGRVILTMFRVKKSVSFLKFGLELFRVVKKKISGHEPAGIGFENISGVITPTGSGFEFFAWVLTLPGSGSEIVFGILTRRGRVKKRAQGQG